MRPRLVSQSPLPSLLTLIRETASSACIMRVAFVGCPSHTCDQAERDLKICGRFSGTTRKIDETFE